MKKFLCLFIGLLLTACVQIPARVERPAPSGERSAPIKVIPAPAQPKPLIDDEAIELRLKAALLAEPAIRGSTISLSSNNGEVRLSGTVPNETALRKATAVAGKIGGVRAVRNNLKVKTK